MNNLESGFYEIIPQSILMKIFLFTKFWLTAIYIVYIVAHFLAIDRVYSHILIYSIIHFHHKHFMELVVMCSNSCIIVHVGTILAF